MPLPFTSELGITDKEMELYELLLRMGEVDAGRLIIESGLKRPTVYKCLYSLVDKGLVSQRDIKKVVHFRPESPQKLLELAERRYTGLERARDDIRNMLPGLTSSYLLSVEKPVVTTFEGVKGLKQIYEDTLREGKDILALLKLVEVNPELEQWLETTYVKKRAEQNVHAKVIVAKGADDHSYIQRSDDEHRSTRVVPFEIFPFQHEVNIYGDKVAFIDYSKGGSLIGIIINHPLIAQTTRAWFDLAWVGAAHVG